MKSCPSSSSRVMRETYRLASCLYGIYLIRWWSSETWVGLSSDWTKGPVDAARLFLDGKSALCPSPSSRRKTASRASMRRSTPLRRGERDCGVDLSIVVIRIRYNFLELMLYILLPPIPPCCG